MIRLKSVTGENVVLYKHLHLPLDQHPVVVIRGQNKDRSNKKSANAVGKSLAYSLIPMLRYGSTPTSVKKKDAKSVHAKDSAIQLDITANDNTDYTLRQFSKGASVRSDIVKDGKTLAYREINAAQKAIANLLPINQDQFYGFVHLDSNNHHPLHRGTTAQRFDFFEQVFQLDVFDKIAKALAKDFTNLKFEVQRLKEIESEHALKTKDLPKEKHKVSVKLRRRMAKKVRKMKVTISKYLKEIRNVSVYMAVAQSISKTEEFDASSMLKEVRAQVKDLEADKAHMRKRFKEATEYFSELKEFERIAEQRDSIKAKLAKIAIADDAPSYDAVVEKIDEYEGNIAVLNTRLEKIAKVTKERTRIKKSMDAVGLEPHEFAFTKATSDKVARQLGGLKEKISTLTETRENLLEHVHDKGNACPVCMRELTPKMRKTLIASVEQTITETKVRYKTGKRIYEYVLLAEEMQQYPKPPSVDGLEKKIASEKKKLEKTNDLKEKYERRKHWQRKLTALPKTLFEKRKMTKPEVFLNSIEGIDKQLQTAATLQENLERLIELKSPYTSYVQAEARMAELQNFIDVQQPALAKLESALSDLDIRLTKHSMVTDELERLQAKIVKHRKAAKDYPIYEALRGVYGAKGLRQKRIMDIAAKYVANLNAYAPLLFSEHIKFSVDITSSKFDILAERNGKVSDVRRLSGSEAKFFILLSVLSLLPHIPAESRCNLIVLDEFDSNLDEPSLQMLIHDFLPKLRSVIPNVVIITPLSKSRLSVPDAVEYMVTKEGGISTLKQVRAAA